MHSNRRVFTILCVCILSAVCALLPAQSESDWYYGKEIRNIRFVGLKAVKSADIDAVVSPFIGQNFSDELYTEILNKIYALEYFEEVTPLALPADSENKTVIIQFTVIERPVVKKLSFSGNSRLRTSELRDTVSVKESDVYIESKVLLDEQKLQNLYLEKGYTKAKVAREVTEVNGEINIVFNISEGQQTVVSAIRFQGNIIATEKNLKKNMKLKEVNLVQKGAFDG